MSIRSQQHMGCPGGSGGKESAIQETWIRFLGREDLLEKGMATHSSILAWRIPWTEKPGGLQTMGSQKSDTTERLTHNTQQRMLLNGLQMVQLVKNQLPIGDARDVRSIPASGRYPGEGNGNPLQYSCLENSMDRGAWWATVHGVAKSQTRLKQLSRHARDYYHNLAQWKAELLAL